MLVTSNNYDQVCKELGFNYKEMDTNIPFMELPDGLDVLVGSTICEYFYPFLIMNDSAHIIIEDDDYVKWNIFAEQASTFLEEPVNTNKVPATWINAANKLGIDPRHFMLYILSFILKYYTINDKGYIDYND